MHAHPFKHFIAYRVPDDVLDEFRAAWAEQLEGHDPFGGEMTLHMSRDPVGGAWRTAGFVAPSANELLLHEVTAGTYLLAVQFNERILPAKVRDEHVRDRVAAIEAREHRRVRRAEYAQIRDEVEFELLPRAFIRRSTVFVMLTGKGDMFIFTSSAKRADDVIALLMELSVFQGRAPQLLSRGLAADPSSLLRRVAQGDGGAFSALDAGVFKGEGKRTIRLKGQEIDDEVLPLLASGYEPQELRLVWSDEDGEPLLHFTLTSQLAFKSVEVSGVQMETLREAGDDAEDAFAVLVANLYSRVVAAVVTSLGGDSEAEDDEL